MVHRGHRGMAVLMAERLVLLHILMASWQRSTVDFQDYGLGRSPLLGAQIRGQRQLLEKEPEQRQKRDQATMTVAAKHGHAEVLGSNRQQCSGNEVIVSS